MMSSSYYMDKKTEIEASCTNNLHTGEKKNSAATFDGW